MEYLLQRIAVMILLEWVVEEAKTEIRENC